jgi:hypothetical protein
MIAYCNYIPDAIWVREVENGVRRVTLRKNFIEKDTANMDGSTEKQYQYDETDICIPDRDNIEDYVNANLDALFTQGIQQTVDNQISDTNKQKAKLLVDSGQISVDLDSLQSQVLTILGV